MLAGTFGLIPRSHPLYAFASQQLLPVCLVLLLIGTDLKALARLGPSALLLMLAGAAGTMIGGLVSWKLYHRWLPPEAWGGIGALTGSWTGGSANMIAVKEALQVPDSIIGPLIIVDAGIAYSWMALLVWSSAWQEKWNDILAGPRPSPRPRVGDRSHGVLAGMLSVRGGPGRTQGPAMLTLARPSRLSKQEKEEDGTARPPTLALPSPRAGLGMVILAVILSISLSIGAQFLSRRIPAMGPAFTVSTWPVLIVTTTALLLSLTRLRKLEEAGVSRLGTWLLYLLLVSIGARADLRMILHTPVFLALGATWILIHGLVLLLAGWALRAPLGLIATASQANIGGVVSAPIVGATFSAQLASIGLLMAVLGNVVGTYLGLGTALAARWLVPTVLLK